MLKNPSYPILLFLLLLLASCRQSLPGEQAEAARYSSLISSSDSLLYNNADTTEALRHFDAALSHLNPSSLYAKSFRYTLLANYHYFFSLDNLATAAMIDSALALFPTAELQNQYPRKYVSLLLFGGQMAYRLMQYNKANDYYFHAKKLANAHLNPCERKEFNYSMAMVLYRQENFQQSVHYFQQAFELQNTCTPQTAATVLQQQEIQDNIGLCFVKLNQYDSAMIYFDRALHIARQYRDSLGAQTMDKIEGVIAGSKAKVAMAENRLEEAEQLSLKSIALNDRPGYETGHALEIKLQLADIYSRKKEFASMHRVLASLSPDMAKADARKRLDWHRLMASCFEQTGKAEAALQYMNTYLQLRDSITLEQKQLTAADINRQLWLKEQDLEISVLKKDNHLAQIYLWMTVVFSLMALTILFLIYANYRRSKKSLAQSLALNEEISHQKAAREAEAKQRHKLITEAVIKAQESERSAIGLELHDNINQVLTTVKLHNEMVIEGIGDPKLLLPRAAKYLQDSINEIRSLSKRLSAPTLGKISLEESIKDLIDSINLTSKVKITHNITGLNHQLLQQDLHIGVYRILQEQLNNVLKHADASEILIQLKQTPEALRLAVSDNGKGFTVAGHKSGIGLMNMQTRAENLNGTFVIKSQPGKGCQIEVMIPIPCVQ